MRSSIKWFLCVLSLTVILFFFLFTLRDGNVAVTVLSGEEYQEILATQTECAPGMYSGTLRIMGEDAPFDTARQTYYIPQSTQRADWDWPLAWSRGTYTAFLCPDEMLQNKTAAIAGNHAFSLLVTDGKQYFTQSIVFTGAPMITLSRRAPIETNSELFIFRAFDPAGSADGGYLVQQAFATFRARGFSSYNWDKKSYRLHLQNAVGKPAKLALFGLRTDDDWIIKSQYLDAQKMRETVCCDLWNALCESPDWQGNIPYSRIAAMEFIMFSDYQGLFFLMEPVGQLSTGLNAKTDVLYKFQYRARVELPGQHLCTPDDLRLLGEFKTGTDGGKIGTPVCDYINTLLTRSKPLSETLLDSQISLSNLIAVSLFAEATANGDMDEKNAYLLCTPQANGRWKYTLFPWDCDLTFGQRIRGENMTLLKIRYCWRTELRTLEAQYPELVRPLIQSSWKKLRETIFSNEALMSRMQAAVDQNVQSGALSRDGERWPHSENNADLTETFDYMTRQLAYLDEAYAALS